MMFLLLKGVNIMAKYSKGIDTKKNILAAARRLFYENGYSNTTTRQIASTADINLGLIKYYFDSKADIALHIYLDVRDFHSDYIMQFGYSDLELNLIASASELKICFSNPHFCQFYHEIYQENKILNTFRDRVSQSLETNSKRPESFRTLAAYCLASIKPALITHYIMSEANHFSAETYIRFYMEQQAYYNCLPDASELCDFSMQELDKFHFDVDENFFPLADKLR